MDDSVKGTVDLVGHRFGKLVVVERARPDEKGRGYSYDHWTCRCDCGFFRDMRTTQLKSGQNKRPLTCRKCTWPRRYKDMVGQRFGKLTVVRYAGISGKYRQTRIRWWCLCDCGKEHEVSGHHLRHGNITSCGCIQILPEQEAGFRRLFDRYKRSALKRSYEFLLTREEFRQLTISPCVYCGAPPSRCSAPNTQGYTPAGVRRGAYVYNGVDRVDNDRGYSAGNVVSCCTTCQFMKGVLPRAWFLEQVLRISEHVGASQTRLGGPVPEDGIWTRTGTQTKKMKRAA